MNYHDLEVYGYQSLYWAIGNLVTADYQLKFGSEECEDVCGLYYNRGEAAAYLFDLVDGMLADTI